MIKPEFWEDEKVGQLSPMARLLFIAALNFADDEGFIRWNEDYISASVFPYDKLSDNKTKRLMKELENLKIVEVFETKFHFFIAKIVNFKRHQKISKPQASKFLQEYESHILKNQSKVENFSGKGSGNNSWNEFSQKEVKGSKEKEKKEKLKEEKGSMKGKETEPKETENSKTDISFVGRQGTANEGTEKGRNTASNTGITMPEGTKSQATISTPSDIISSTSVNTFKARVDYAKRMGVEESVARRLCNFAQSSKFSLSVAHYKGFAGKSGKEAEEAFELLNFLAKGNRNPKCQGHDGLKRINSS
jgi:hypothetical protein